MVACLRSISNHFGCVDMGAKRRKGRRCGPILRLSGFLQLQRPCVGSAKQLRVLLWWMFTLMVAVNVAIKGIKTFDHLSLGLSVQTLGSVTPKLNIYAHACLYMFLV